MRRPKKITHAANVGDEEFHVGDQKVVQVDFTILNWTCTYFV